MIDKEKRELKDSVISIFKNFNILDNTATIGGLRDDILRYINSLQEEHVSKEIGDYDHKVVMEALHPELKEEHVSIWHDASEKSDNLEDVVIINPSDNTGHVLTKCTGVNQGHIWAYTSELLKLDNPCKIGKNLQEELISEELEEAVDGYTRKVLERTNCLIGNQPVGEEISKAVKFGAKWQKKQMSAKAIDAELCSDGMFTPLISVNDKEKISNIKFGDKVKVVLLKK